MAENQFSSNIKNLYSDNGGEYIKLKHFPTSRGINHFTTALNTLQQNGIV